MPQIKEYTAEEDKLRPTETGVEAFAQAGRRIGAFYNQAAEAITRTAQDKARAAETLAGAEKAKFGAFGRGTEALGGALDAATDLRTHQQISQGAANLAQTTNDLNNEWNDIKKNADSNAYPVLQPGFFEQKFEPWAEKYLQGFDTPGGRDYARKQIDNLRHHFYEKTTADTATMAGDAFQVSLTKMSTNLTNAARISPDVHSIDALMKQAGDSVHTLAHSTPGLSGNDAAKAETEYLYKIQRDIVHGGALGAIEKAADPHAAALDIIKQYPDFINEKEADQLEHSAQYYKHLNDTQEKSDRAEKIHADRLDFNTKAETLMGTTIPDKPGDPPQMPDDYWDQVRELTKHPGAGLEPGRIHSLIAYGEAVTSRRDKTEPSEDVSHETSMQLMSDIHAGKITNENALFDAYGAAKLRNSDFNFLRNELSHHNTPDGRQEDYFKKELTQRVQKTLMRFNRPGDADRMYRWQYELKTRMDKLQQQGKDRMAVFDPNSPEYMGSDEKLQPFKSPIAQRIQGVGGVGAPLPATVSPAVSAPKVPTLPSKDKLVVGQTYETSGGPGTWTGTGFKLVKPTTLKPGEM
jgi:hypothetical protein